MDTCIVIAGNKKRGIVTCTHKKELADVEVEDAHRWRMDCEVQWTRMEPLCITQCFCFCLCVCVADTVLRYTGPVQSVPETSLLVESQTQVSHYYNTKHLIFFKYFNIPCTVFYKQ